ncbi:Steroid 17-alpha-hydroxylase/17,20 lyase [Cytospora mali]|uniref:Steroid 17-alpha-hydroxylase/17,20 lyase n=1 Tax=Cytospora mali TaxID=578113 RepID=A0A194VYQ1_CYTMA|nr:Steroid 17-alpha-hydroxylase/17,20 lyase [Valsa mali]
MLDILSLAHGPYLVLAGLLLFTLFPVAQWVVSTLRPRSFPPGPPVIPGLGNLLQIPTQKPYLKFHTWAKQYGDLISLKTGTGNLVVINNPKIVHELFVKRGAIYSNRPVSHVNTKHIWYGPEDKAAAILQYDEYYRRWRKCFQYILSTAGIKRILPLLEAESSKLCYKFLDDEAPYKESVRNWVLGLPLIATSGRRLEDMPPGYASDFFQTQEDFLKLLVPGAAPPVDVFPILAYVPEFLAKWKSEARRLRGLFNEDAWRFVTDGRKQYAQIQENPDSVRFEGLIAKILREQSSPETTKGDRHFTDLELGYLAQAVVGATVDTTTAAFETLMCCFAAFPHVLKRAQEEVDRLAGDKPPTGELVGDLVYLKACISEVLRWRPVAASAVPHTLATDDRFGDYVFPKGTTFIANAWTIHRNENEYERPEEFDPERFVKNPYGFRTDNNPASQEKLDSSGRRALYTFGSGRRQCPGEQFAFTSTTLAASKLIWAFDVLPPLEGVDLSIESGYEDGLLSRPKDPRVVFKLRSETRRGALAQDTARLEAIAMEMLG